MKTTMKILPLLFGVMLFFTQCEKEAEIDGSANAEAFMNLKVEDADCYVKQDLWAGAGQNITENGTLVGEVIASITDGILTVEYELIDGWYYVETHLWVGGDFNDIPRNAAPGRFPYSGGLLFEDIDLSELGIAPGQPVYIAAHAVVANDEDGYADFEALDLPEAVVFEHTAFGPNSVSYFDPITILGDGWLAGDYDGWCADPEEIIGGNPRSGIAYSSYDVAFLDEDLTPYAFDYPENLPLVNWVINYDFVGIEGGDFTLGDVQRAIWLLLWENPDMDVLGGVGPYDDNRVQDIIDMAEVEGEFFMPGCDDFLVLVIVQDDVTNKQPVFIKIPVPCMGTEETAWAFGGDEENDYTFIFNKIANNWGWFFEITYCE